MKLQFRILVVAGLLFHAVSLVVLPMFPSLFSPYTLELMKYGGHGARVNPTHPFIYAFYLIPYPALIGIYFLRNWARHLLLLFAAVLSLGTFVLGVSISGPPATFIAYVGILVDGAIIGLAYLSPLKDEFSRRRDVN